MKTSYLPTIQRTWSRGKASPPTGSDELATSMITPSKHALAFPEQQFSFDHTKPHPAWASCQDPNAMVPRYPPSSTMEHNTSNTSLTAQTSPRFGQTSPPFSWIPAALDLSLDALLNGTVCPSNPARPRRGLTTRTMSTMSRCSAIKRHPSPSHHHLPHSQQPSPPPRALVKRVETLPWPQHAGKVATAMGTARWQRRTRPPRPSSPLPFPSNPSAMFCQPHPPFFFTARITGETPPSRFGRRLLRGRTPRALLWGRKEQPSPPLRRPHLAATLPAPTVDHHRPR
jgi:hypothetical protein